MPSKLTFEKPKRKPKNRSARKKRDGRYSAERLKYLHGKPCCVCGKPGDVHHVHDGGEPPDDYKTITLCFDHHQGFYGVHTIGRGLWEFYFGNLKAHQGNTDALLIGDGLGHLVKVPPEEQPVLDLLIKRVAKAKKTIVKDFYDFPKAETGLGRLVNKKK